MWRLNHHRPVHWQTLWCRGRDNELLWWSARLPIVVDCADDTVGIISQSLSTYLSFVPSRSPLLFVVVTLWSAHRSSVVIIVVRPPASARFVLLARPSSQNRRQVADAAALRKCQAAVITVRSIHHRDSLNGRRGDVRMIERVAASGAASISGKGWTSR